MNPAPVKCRCQNCDGYIEFEAAQVGQTVACPHCGMDTRLFIPGNTRPPVVEGKAPSRPANTRRVLMIVVCSAVGLVFAGFIFSAVESNATIAALGGGILGLVIAAFAVIWALLWILFPVFVYFALEHMKKTLDQIERNTRR